MVSLVFRLSLECSSFLGMTFIKRDGNLRWWDCIPFKSRFHVSFIRNCCDMGSKSFHKSVNQLCLVNLPPDLFCFKKSWKEGEGSQRMRANVACRWDEAHNTIVQKVLKFEIQLYVKKPYKNMITLQRTTQPFCSLILSEIVERFLAL